ncbi:MAG: transcriptional regulator GcvA [Alphaproteobacteria bacterium]|nr:transcriptional regulator GcvA [Alphaproteobacteria bacterium]
MARRLPSLNGLKAFEAAARLESFSEAADSLFVTHAAISRHIRELEDYLGTELFTRTGRGVVLTEAGRRFSTKLTPLFDQLADAAREAAAVGQARALKVSVQPAFASRWLVSRLGHFNTLHPDIELHVDPSNELADFRSDDVDVGLRYGRGDWDDVEAVRLTDVVYFPVCSPKFLARHPDIKPADLPRLNLLHEDKKEWWAEWLEFAGVAKADVSRGPLFQAQLALEAAESGQGFALGDQLLCTDSLIDGWLVRPFNQDMKAEGAYWLVRRKGQRENGPMRAFREWLAGEIVETNKKFQAFKAQGLKPA